MQCTCQHWISTKWLEIEQDNLRMKFSAFNVDFSSPSPDPLGLRRRRRRAKTATPLKSGYFTTIILCSMKTIADRYVHPADHNKHWWQAFWIYQHRWLWTTLKLSKRGFWWIFRKFWMQRTFQHWIATKWLAIDQDNLRMKFSAFNVDFSSTFPTPWAQGGQLRQAWKTATPLKSGYFTVIVSCSVKTVADRPNVQPRNIPQYPHGHNKPINIWQQFELNKKTRQLIRFKNILGLQIRRQITFERLTEEVKKLTFSTGIKTNEAVRWADMQKRILIIRRTYTKTSIGNGRFSTNIDDGLGNWHIEKLYA